MHHKASITLVMAIILQEGQAGETQKEKDVVTISPSKMIDYLDKELVFKVDDENNKKYGWTMKKLEDIKNGKYVTENVEKSNTK